MDWMGLEKIEKKFDLFRIKTYPIPLNPHGLRANRTSPKVEHRALGVLPGGRQGVRQPFAPSSDQGASCRLATGATGHVERVIAKGAFYGSGWPWGRWSLILMRSMLP
jgi:hypothetical protein